MFLNRGRKKQQDQPVDTQPKQAPQEDYTPPLWQPMNEPKVPLAEPLRLAVIDRFYPQVQAQCDRLRQLGDSRHTPEAEQAAIIRRQLKESAIQFAAKYDQQAQAVAANLSTLGKLAKETSALRDRSRRLYATCAATAQINELPVLAGLLQDFENRLDRLLPGQVNGELSVWVQKIRTTNPLKALAGLERELEKWSHKLMLAGQAMVDSSGPAVEHMVYLCEEISHIEAMRPHMQTLVSRWREKYGRFYFQGSSEAWAADSRRNAPQDTAAGTYKHTSAILRLYQRAMGLDSQAEALVKNSRFKPAEYLQDSERLIACGELEQALIHAKAALQAGPASPDAFILLGRIYERSGLPLLAHHAFISAIAANPHNPNAYERLRRVARDANRLEALSSEFQHLKALHPNVFELDLQLALTQMSAHRHEQALAAVASLERRYPKSGDLYYVKALILQGLANGLNEIQKTVESALAKPFSSSRRHAEAHLLLGHLCEPLQSKDQAETDGSNLQRALKSFSDGIEADPHCLECYRAFARLDGLLSAPDWTQAALRHLAERHNTSAAYLALAESYLTPVADAKGEQKFSDAALSSAASALKRAHELEPTSPSPLEALGGICEQQGATTEAFKHYLAAQRMYPCRSEMFHSRERLSQALIRLLQADPALISIIEGETAEGESPYGSSDGVTMTMALPAADISLEDSSFPTFKIDLPPLLISRFSGYTPEHQALLELDIALTDTRDPAAQASLLANFTQILQSSLGADFRRLRYLFSINEPGSKINRSHAGACKDAASMLSSIDSWLKSVEGYRKISPALWQTLSERIFPYLDPQNSMADLSNFAYSLKQASHAARELDSSSPIFSDIQNLQGDLESALDKAMAKWDGLRSCFSVSSQSAEATIAEVRTLRDCIDRVSRLLSDDFFNAATNLGSGLDKWLEAGTRLLLSTCLGLEPGEPQDNHRSSDVPADSVPVGLRTAEQKTTGIESAAQNRPSEGGLDTATA